MFYMRVRDKPHLRKLIVFVSLRNGSGLCKFCDGGLLGKDQHT